MVRWMSLMHTAVPYAIRTKFIHAFVSKVPCFIGRLCWRSRCFYVMGYTWMYPCYASGIRIPKHWYIQLFVFKSCVRPENKTHITRSCKTILNRIQSNCYAPALDKFDSMDRNQISQNEIWLKKLFSLM